MSVPFFSIVIPTHNRPDSLRRTIQSVLDQSCSDWELIIVDDGGERGVSESLIHSFGDDRIKYFWKMNEERSIARNFGFQESLGRYVVPLDSDDQLLVNHLASFLVAIEYHGQQGFFHGSFVIRDTETDSIVRVTRPLRNRILEALTTRAVFAIGAAAIRRDVALSLPFPNSKYAVHGEDWLFFLKIYAAHDVIWLDEEVFCYLVSPHSSVRNIDPERFRQSYELLFSELKVDKQVLGKFGFYKFNTFLGYQYLQVAIQAVVPKSAMLVVGLKYFFQAIRVAPWILMSRSVLVWAKFFFIRSIQRSLRLDKV